MGHVASSPTCQCAQMAAAGHRRVSGHHEVAVGQAEEALASQASNYGLTCQSSF